MVAGNGNGPPGTTSSKLLLRRNCSHFDRNKVRRARRRCHNLHFSPRKMGMWQRQRLFVRHLTANYRFGPFEISGTIRNTLLVSHRRIIYELAIQKDGIFSKL